MHHQVVRLSLPSLVVLGEGDPVHGALRAVADAAASTPGSGQQLLVLHLPHVEVRAAGRAACVAEP
jgi:hypothetical protein